MNKVHVLTLMLGINQMGCMEFQKCLVRPSVACITINLVSKRQVSALDPVFQNRVIIECYQLAQL